MYPIAGINYPIAGNASYNVNENTTNNVLPSSVSGQELLNLALATGASHGSASISGFNFLYTPNSGYSGADSFTYVVINAAGSSGALGSIGTISVNVIAINPVVTTGTASSGLTSWVGYDNGGVGFGSAFGSITPSTISNFGSNAIGAIVWEVVFSGGSPAYTVRLCVANQGNGGFSNMNINGQNFARASASYFLNASGYGQWNWTATSTSPFGTSAGVPITVTFT